MTLYRHHCGKQMRGRLDQDGCSYRIRFFGPVSGAELARCPGCDADLADALQRGDLREQTTGDTR